MRWSLAQLLDAVAPRLDRRLVAGRELAAVRSLLARLPADLSDWIYLEFRLCPRDTRIDVIVRIDRARADVLTNDRWCLEPPAHGDAAWQRARAFARQWADPRVRWSGAVENLWLEFDFDGSGLQQPGLPRPRFFTDFTKPMAQERLTEASWRLACDTMGVLAPHRVPRAIAAPLRRILQALPAGASLFSVGLRSGDSAAGLRVCLTGVTRCALPAFFDAIGLGDRTRGVSNALDAVLDTRHGTVAPLILDLDVTPAGAAAPAIELAFARRPQLRGRIDEQHLLDRLVALGLADAASIAALRAWPGCEIARLPHVFWPALLVRRLNHVKLAFDGDRVAAVKAYPCLFHRYSPRIAPRLYSIDRARDCGAAGRTDAGDARQSG